MYGLQSNAIALSVSHALPAALQYAAPTPLDVVTHWFRAHSEPGPAPTHPPLPSQVPRHESEGPHSFFRSVPSGSAVQVPGDAGSTHE
jgi:hypothetical protein